jgi:hypothetical protein
MIFSVFLRVHTDAQVFLQLEKTGTLKTFRYTEGDLLTFRLKNDDKGWYERTIVSIDAPGNRLVFPDVSLSVDSIEAIRLERKAVGAQILGGALQIGGINQILFTAYYAIFQDRKLDWTSMGFGALNVVVGTVLKRLFRHPVFRVSQRKRLRLIDLNFSAPMKS